MKIKRTTEIFVETHRRFVIRQPKAGEQIVCPNCDGTMLAAEQIAVLFDLSCRAVYRLVEEKTVHFSETDAGVIFVCPDSFSEIAAGTE